MVSKVLARSTEQAPRYRSRVPHIALRHGQVLWLLTELGYRGGVSGATFYEYIKSLRKLGIPFGRRRFRTKRKRRLATYSYCHVMELVIALSLRVYQTVPDSVLREVIRHRRRFHQFYRRAYTERYSGAGSPIAIQVKNRDPIELSGLFLDLDIKFTAGQMAHFNQPRLLSPIEVLTLLSEDALSGRTFFPTSLSLLSEVVIALASNAPLIRSGPHNEVE
jgi:hypothetical protein